MAVQVLAVSASSASVSLSTIIFRGVLCLYLIRVGVWAVLTMAKFSSKVTEEKVGDIESGVVATKKKRKKAGSVLKRMRRARLAGLSKLVTFFVGEEEGSPEHDVDASADPFAMDDSIWRKGSVHFIGDDEQSRSAACSEDAFQLGDDAWRVSREAAVFA